MLYQLFLYIALPNKLFEVIQSKTPLLVSDLPEMSKVVKKYGIGEVVDTQSTEDVCKKIDILLKNGKAFYKDNLELAVADLVWDKEKEILISAYRKVN